MELQPEPELLTARRSQQQRISALGGSGSDLSGQGGSDLSGQGGSDLSGAGGSDLSGPGSDLSGPGSGLSGTSGGSPESTRRLQSLPLETNPAAQDCSTPRGLRRTRTPSRARVDEAPQREVPCRCIRHASRPQCLLGAVTVMSPAMFALVTLVALSADDAVGAMPRVFEFARSISTSVLVLHAVWFDEWLVDPDYDSVVDVIAESSRCALRWPTTGCIARIFGCAASVSDEDTELQKWSRTKGLPDAILTTHFVLYGLVLAAYPALRATSSTGEEVTVLYRVQTTGTKLLLVLAAFWLSIQVRRAVLGVATDQHSMRRVSIVVVRAMAASIAVQICLLCKFLIWHGDVDAVVRVAIQNGFPRDDLDGQRDIFFSLVNLSGAVSAISLWLAITISLGLFDNDLRDKHTLGKTLPIQLLLMAALLLACAIAFMWVDSEITKGDRRYQLTDGAGVVIGSCNATCNLTPPLTFVHCAVSLGLQYAVQGECTIDVQMNIISLICVPIAFLLLGYDLHRQDSFNQKLKLPPGKKYHFFICHHQGSGGAQCAQLYHQLTNRGCKVWYDNEQPAEERVEAGMRRGVQSSMTLLIFLSGRKETFDPETKCYVGDRNGQYEGTFTRHYCHEEMYTARMSNCHIIGISETDARHNVPDWRLERTRALTGGPGGGPVHKRAEENLKLLDRVNFIPKRVQAHETEAYLQEVIKQGLEGWREKRASIDWANFEDTSVAQPERQQLAVDWQDSARADYPRSSVERTRSVVERGAHPAQQAPSLLAEVLPTFVMPASKTHHFCICNQLPPSAPGNRAASLASQLTAKFGLKVVYPDSSDNLQAAVANSVCLLVFLGGKGGCAFASPTCRRLIEHALFEELPVVGVGESDPAYTAMDIPLEQRAAPQEYAQLLAEINFLPTRSLEHEVSGFLTEIVRQGLGRLSSPQSPVRP